MTADLRDGKITQGRKHHYLKCQTQFYQLSEKGIKTFEIRLNDRDFKVCDYVHLKEFVGDTPTFRELEPKEIKYILEGGQYGLDPNYVILQF